MKRYKVRIPVTSAGEERFYLRDRMEQILVEVFNDLGYDLIEKSHGKRKHKDTNTMRIAYVDFTFERRSIVAVLKAITGWRRG